MLTGKNDWTFQTDEGIFGKLAHSSSPTESSNWEVMSAHRVNACKQIAGAEYLTLVCPEKACVYERMLPDDIAISPTRPAVSISAALQPRVMYPLNLLCWEASEFLTYGASESHWNDYGAYVVYKQVIEVLSGLSGKRISTYEDPEFIMKDGEGYCDIGPSHERVTWFPKNTKGRCIFDNLIWSRGNIKICVNPDPSLPTLVIFRDSFANMLLPFLMESFRRIVSISSWHPMLEVVKREQPDYVICQTAERYLIPDSYTRLPRFEELCRADLSTLDKDKCS